MLRSFFPYEYVNNVFQIDYVKLYKDGIRGVIFDIDNTLVHHGESSNVKVDNLFKELKKIGLTPLLLSDNSEERINCFNRANSIINSNKKLKVIAYNGSGRILTL